MRSLSSRSGRGPSPRLGPPSTTTRVGWPAVWESTTRIMRSELPMCRILSQEDHPDRSGILFFVLSLLIAALLLAQQDQVPRQPVKDNRGLLKIDPIYFDLAA